MQETVEETEEVDGKEKWTQLKGRSSVLGETLMKGCKMSLMSLLPRRCKHCGQRGIAKWTGFIVDYTMPI